MKLDQILNEIRNAEPDAAEAQQAAARVKARLFPAAASAPSANTTIRSCADFTALIPDRLAGTLDGGRKLLFDVHTRECVGCRKAFDYARFGSADVTEIRKPVRSAGAQYAGWAIAASALLALAVGGYWEYGQYPALAGGPRATVDRVDGAIYKVVGAGLTPLAPGAELGENDSVRTAKNSMALLRLNDGSRIEMNQRAQVFVTRNVTGSVVHLGLGSIIVQAAKQRNGSLQVVTPDCNVSVKGTTFSVDAGTKGSRVAVAEGTVWVDHGSVHEVLHRGNVTSTDPGMGTGAIRDEFEWSPSAARYMSLLGEFAEINRRIDAIPAAELRHESRLMAWLPTDTSMVAAIPNVSSTIAQADRIFHARLGENPALNAWWKGLAVAQRNQFETTLTQLETATAYLGPEIVIAGSKQNLVILAQIVKPGLDSFFKSQPAADSYKGHMRFDNDLFVAASNTADLARITPSGDFLHSALYGKIAPLYQQGAGWLFAADLLQMGKLTQIADARFVVAQSRAVAGDTENRATVTFSKPRTGIASWLAAPGPMGSLDFISPDATFAVSMLLKSPSLMVNDLTKPMPDDPELRREMAETFGGEVSVALDGPLLPVPSWKIAAEVYDSDRLQSIIAKLVAPDPSFHLTQTDSDGRTFYTLKSDKLPWEADWTYVDGYWLAAANHELLVRSIQNRQTGYSLAKSNAFKAMLPSDASTDFSALLAWKSGVIGLWAGSDSIEAANKGNLMGMTLENLLSMNTQRMMETVMGQAVPSAHGAQ